MRVFNFEEVISTSTLASQWLESGKNAPPFAISAASQEQGRGRQGRSWQSPVGNIYLSLALGAKDCGLRQMQLLPLKAGVVVADWLKAQFGISVTLKWPNDILFGGAKLGGILCESSVRGSSISNAVIGIGINVNKSPRINADYESTSLSEIFHRDFDIERLVKSFCKFWETNSERVNDANTIQWFNGYSLDDGQLWEDANTAEQYCYESVASDGSMMLQSLRTNGELITVNSAHQELRWVYQSAKKDYPVYVCDVGNSRIKLARFATVSDSEPEEAKIFALDDLQNPKDLARLFRKDKLPLFVLSVNPPALERLSDLMEAIGRSLVPLRKRRVYTFGDSYAFANIGSDRLAAMEAAVKSLKKPQPLVVVSAGTATTVDLISHEREHLGGWIVPGIKTALASLHEKTSALPDLIKVLPDVGPQRLGVDTPSAMLGGVLNMQLGLVEKAAALLAQHEKTDKDDVGIRVTGGFGPWLCADKKRMRYDGHLILKGIKSLATGGR